MAEREGLFDADDESVVAYWRAFDAHLQTLPITGGDREQRHALVATARGMGPGDYLPPEDPAQAARRAYRFRFVLGPTFSPEEIDEMRREVMQEEADLLAQGYSLELLGSRNWGGPFG
jgi:hypothetical protein